MARTGGNRCRGGEGIFGVARFNPLGKVSFLSGVLVLLLAGGLELGRLARAEAGRGVALAQSGLADRKARADRLLQQGIAQLRKSQLQEALQSWEAALDIYREVGDRQGQANSLGNLGIIYRRLSQYRRAIKSHQQSLAITREIGDLRSEANSLGNLGSAHKGLGQYEQAIDFYQQSLAIQRDVGNLRGEATILGNLGSIYRNLGQYERAIDFHQQSLTIAREIDDASSEANSLGNLGNVYFDLSQYERAIGFHQQSATIDRKIGNRLGEASSLGNLGIAYYSLGKYEYAIDLHQQHLVLARDMGNQQGEANALGNLGNTYRSLGEYERAIESYKQSIAIARKIGDRKGEGASLGNLGLVYHSLGKYERALDFHQRSIIIARKIGDRQSEANFLSNLGLAHNELGEYERAIDFHQQQLAITREIGNLQGEAISLNNLGYAYAAQDQYVQAIPYTQQALAYFRSIKDRSAEGIALSDLGQYLNALNHPQLAITFYKASVDVREAIRGDITGLDPTLQQSYTDTIADDYRALADLLLQQSRIPEAQRVLDLLKVQELDDYFNGVQRNADTATGIAKRPAEQNILDRYIEIVLAAEELAQLTSRPPKALSDTERQRLRELNAKQDQLSRSFTAFLDRTDVAEAIAALNPSSGQPKEALEPEHFKQLKDNLANLPQPSALLYPLILPDRLEMVLVLPDAAPVRVAVPVTQTELTQTIVAFGQDLSNPRSDPLPHAQQLHDWLLKDFEPALTAAGVTNLIYAPDGALRYIPLAALYDSSQPNGQRWIAQRYSVSNITAASLIDFDSQPSGDLRLFAGACAECSFSFEVGDRNFNFRDLPATETEVKALAESFTDNTILLNQAFSPAELKLNRGYYNLLHLATHAAFVEGDPRESFIVFGDGSRVSLRQIREDWDLSNQELIVLSACQTAVGGSQLGNGAEVLGLGYQMQASGAKAALSSLWLVSDSGTQQLMNAFYDALRQDGMSKSQALQQAQRMMIESEGKGGEGDRASVQVVGDRNPDNASLSHPYYWAPFILIGNGL